MARKRDKPQEHPGQEEIRDSSQVETPTARSTDPFDGGADRADVRQEPDRFAPPPDSRTQEGRGVDQLPGHANADLGAAGGGATGPGNADRNLPGANSGGAVAGEGTGGVTQIDTGVGKPDEPPNPHGQTPKHTSRKSRPA